jgi:hypothetical protein
MIDQSEILSNSYVQFITLFFGGHTCVTRFTSHGKMHKFGPEKPIFWSKPAYFDIFTINFTGVTYPAPLEMLLDLNQTL